MSSWIRVEDRLPDKDGYYLIYYKSGIIDESHLYNLNELDYKIRAIEDIDYEHRDDILLVPGLYGELLNPKDDYITHWMPLPEPPSEVKTNVFDHEDTYADCTVQVLTNTTTGETSVGWWRNGRN